MHARSTLPFSVVSASLFVLFLLVYSTAGPPTSHSHTSHSIHSHSHYGNHSSHNLKVHKMDMMMPMWFMWTVDTILWFHGWHPTTLLPYLGTIALLMAFAIAHEALASYRVSWAKYSSPAVASAAGYVPAPGGRKQTSMLQLRLINSLLYTGNITTGYLLMLAVMSFNVGYFLAVVVGMGVGHFMFFSKPWHLEFARVDACCETTVGLQT